MWTRALLAWAVTLALGLPAMAADETVSLGANTCTNVDLSSTAHSQNDSIWVETKGRCLTWELEADHDDVGTTIVLSAHSCSRNNSAACGVFDYRDSDADGVVDDNLIDATTAGRRGIHGCARIARWVRFNVDTAAGAGENAELALCFTQ